MLIDMSLRFCERYGFMEKKTDAVFKIREMAKKDNLSVAGLIRYNLKKNGLDIPGTVYFDKGIDNLYEFYSGSAKRGYYVLTDEEDNVVGGIGFDEFSAFYKCAELQKLYLADSVKGLGFGRKLIAFIEQKMLKSGFESVYLETHTNLERAIYVYEKSGYKQIERPKEVMHGAMNVFLLKELMSS